jgi:hypothetical protein
VLTLLVIGFWCVTRCSETWYRLGSSSSSRKLRYVLMWPFSVEVAAAGCTFFVGQLP